MRQRIDTSSELLLPITLLLCFFLGFEEGGFQFVLLKIAKEFGLNNAYMGSLVSVQFSAIIISTLFFGSLADRVGKKLIILLFGFVFIIGCFTVLFSLSILVVIIGIFILGCGFSICESSAIAALADAHGINSGKYINISQCFFSMGAVIGPLITHYGMDHFGVNWRVVFAISGCGYLFLMVPLLFTRFNNVFTSKFVRSIQKSTTITMFFFPTFLCLFITALIYVSMENGLSFFLDSLFINVLDAPKFSAFSISLFWLAMVPSRLLASLVNKKQSTLLIVGFSGAAVFLLLLAFTNNTLIALASSFILGLFYGPIWPTAISMATQEFPYNSGRVTSIMLAGSGVGGASIPILMGSLADFSSIRVSYGVLSILALIGLLVVLKYRDIKNIA